MIENLGWYEQDPAPSINMIDRCSPGRDHLLLDVGSGASTLITALVARGYRNLLAVDISPVALREARDRLTNNDSRFVQWVVDDILDPIHLDAFEHEVQVWHDRAMFHFLTEEDERAKYLNALKRLVADGGHVIIAAFSLKGVDRCSGLPVRRYDADLIEEFLGPGFDLVQSFEHLYVTPGGENRPYVYTLFRRRSGSTE